MVSMKIFYGISINVVIRQSPIISFSEITLTGDPIVMAQFELYLLLV